MNKKILIITRTGLFLALLLVFQYLGSLIGVPLVKQLVTGSLVNLILLLSVTFCGIFGGVVIAIVSPFLAFLIGITPLPSMIIVPFIAIGNLIFVCITGLMFYKDCNSNYGIKKSVLIRVSSGIIGSFIKFAAIYVGVILIALPLILESKAEAMRPAITNALTASFTWLQLFTALISCVIAFFLIPSLKKVLSK